MLDEYIGAFQSVKDWLDGVALRRTGSALTRARYIKELVAYCNYRKMNPDELLKEDKPYRKDKKQTIAEQNVTKYFVYLEKEKKASRATAKSTYGILRSFFRYNEIMFVEKSPTQSGVKGSYSLPREKVRAAIEAADLKAKFVITGLASTGMRPGDFIKLKYGDIAADYEANEQRLYIEMSNKEDLLFGVFLSTQATKFLRQMIEERKANGEVMKKDTPLLAHEKVSHKGKKTEGSIGEDELHRILVDAGKRVRLPLTAKLFRKNFRTLCSPIIGSDAVCKMASWTLPGVGKNYFLPPKEECLKSYRQIESLISYEEEKTNKEKATENLINFAIAQGLPMDKAETLRKVSREQALREEEVAKMLQNELKQTKTEAGGLPFQQAASKALEDIIVDAIKGVKQRLS